MYVGIVNFFVYRNNDDAKRHVSGNIKVIRGKRTYGFINAWKLRSFLFNNHDKNTHTHAHVHAHTNIKPHTKTVMKRKLNVISPSFHITHTYTVTHHYTQHTINSNNNTHQSIITHEINHYNFLLPLNIKTHQMAHGTTIVFWCSKLTDSQTQNSTFSLLFVIHLLYSHFLFTFYIHRSVDVWYYLDIPYFISLILFLVI